MQLTRGVYLGPTTGSPCSPRRWHVGNRETGCCSIRLLALCGFSISQSPCTDVPRATHHGRRDLEQAGVGDAIAYAAGRFCRPGLAQACSECAHLLPKARPWGLCMSQSGLSVSAESNPTASPVDSSVQASFSAPASPTAARSTSKGRARRFIVQHHQIDGSEPVHDLQVD